jgi:signal peptidase I
VSGPEQWSASPESAAGGEPAAPRGRRTGRWLGPLVAGAVALALVAAALLVFVARADTKTYRMRAESMVPTFQVGEQFTINRDAYEDGEPQVGDIVVFHPPLTATGDSGASCGRRVSERRLCDAAGREFDADVTFAKRIVARGGDRIRIEDGRVIRNGRPSREPFIAACPGGAATGCTFSGEITVPPGTSYLLGDNRGASDDSRFWGPVPDEQLVGRVDRCSFAGLSCEPRR